MVPSVFVPSNDGVKNIRDTGSINLSTSSGRPRTIRTEANVRKVKNRLIKEKPSSTRKLALELGISRASVQRILKDDLQLLAYRVLN